MGSIYINGTTAGYPAIDQVIVNAGLSLSLWNGWAWNTRSSGGFEQLLGVVVHHTASGSGTSFQNDWAYCAQNHADAPVANILLGRDGHVGLHSGGASNHAGKGGPWQASKGTIPTDAANSRTIGIEAQNNGVGEMWAPVMLDAYERLVAALCDAYGLLATFDVPGHFQWAPSRKIDPWGGSSATAGYPYTGPREWDMAGFTANVAARMGGHLPPPTTGDLMLNLITVNGAGAKFVGMIDSKGLGHTVSWVRTQGELDTYARLGAVKRTLNLDELAGLWLVGPLPTGDHSHNWSGSEFHPV